MQITNECSRGHIYNSRYMENIRCCIFYLSVIYLAFMQNISSRMVLIFPPAPLVSVTLPSYPNLLLIVQIQHIASVQQLPAFRRHAVLRAPCYSSSPRPVAVTCCDILNTLPQKKTKKQTINKHTLLNFSTRFCAFLYNSEITQQKTWRVFIVFVLFFLQCSVLLCTVEGRGLSFMLQVES